MKHLLIFTIILSNILFAGSGNLGFSSARYESQGGTGVANPDRVYSVGMNPAGTMMLGDSSFFQFNVGFPNFGIGINNESFGTPEFEEYFSNDGKSKILSSQEEEEFISLFEDGNELMINSRINFLRVGFLLSPKLGAFTFSIDDNISFRANQPKELVALAMRGNELGSTYNFDDFSYQAAYLRSYSINYARPLITESEGFFKNLNIGVSAKLVQSFGYADFETNSASLHTDSSAKITLAFDAVGRSAAGDELYNQINNDGEFSPIFPSAGGSGIGFDVGAIGELQNGIRLGVSITDIGTINHDTNVEIATHALSTIVEELIESEIDSITDGGNKTISDESFDVTMPTALRFGATIPVHKFVPFMGLLNASIDVHQGLNNNFANSTNTRFAVGAEWLPFQSLPSVLVGYGNDRFNKSRVTLGFGYSIKLFDVYLGSRDFLSTISGGRRASLMLNIRWKIW
jgi:hypothetical protein